MTGAPTRRQVATEFLHRFCAGDVDGLVSLLHDDLLVTGPFLRARSRAAYLDSLRTDPPEQCNFRMISMTEDGDAVAAFYDYQKRSQSLTVAQLFKFKQHRISEMLLVFDGREIISGR